MDGEPSSCVRKSQRRFGFLLPRHCGYDARVMDARPTKRGGPLYWLARRSRRFWLCLALVPVLYVVSVGPACWCADHCHRDETIVVLRRVYWPLRSLLACLPKPVTYAALWWSDLGCEFGGPGFFTLGPGSDDLFWDWDIAYPFW